MNQLFIVNQADRPCERLIAEEREGSLFYIHPEMQKEWSDKPMSLQEATPLEHFGILTSVVDGKLYGQFLCPATATYPDDGPRRWQGSLKFSFRVSADPADIEEYLDSIALGARMLLKEPCIPAYLAERYLDAIRAADTAIYAIIDDLKDE